MLRSTRTAAEHLGVSKRQVNRLAQAGLLVTDRLGDATLVSDRALEAARRTTGRGRRWAPHTAEAALELIQSSETTLLGSAERSRLRARIRAADASELAYQLLPGRVSLWRRTGATPSTPSAIADRLGLAADGGLAVIVADDAAHRARALRLVHDTEGDVLIVEGADAHRLAWEALGLFAYGGTRESSAARRWLQQQVRRL